MLVESVLGRVFKYSPHVDQTWTHEDLVGFRRTQNLALRAAQEVAGYLQEGWTEIRAAELLSTCLRDYGASSFFHDAFAWFGERAGFHGVNKYRDFMPSTRVLLPNEGFILDVAPIYQGYPADIGYSGYLGKNEPMKKAEAFLQSIKPRIPELFAEVKTGAGIWERVDEWIREAGYENAHKKYPFGVLGHRLRPVPGGPEGPRIMRFGWRAVHGILSRGLGGEILDPNRGEGLNGLWAIEPHIAGPGFGTKFEEILVVKGAQAQWLSEMEL